MNIFGLKVVSPSGVTVLDPDAYTVRLVEVKLYMGGRGGYIEGQADEWRYVVVPMSSAVKAGMFAVLSPIGEYDTNLNIEQAHFGFGTVVNTIELGMPTATVQNGQVTIDEGPVTGDVTRNLAIYVLAYD